MQVEPTFVERLNQARGGDGSAQGDLLRRFEPWLRLLARVQVESRFAAKFDASDVVQQTLLEAVKAFPQFRGSTEAELTAWLRTILAHALAHEMRRYHGTAKRDITQEVSLEAELAQSSHRLGALLAESGPTPSQQVARRELDVVLADILARLPEDYRDVLIFRHLENLSHDEIAARMNRSAGAVRMLWVRALAALREACGSELDELMMSETNGSS
ncbi:MAG: ECF subfamily RNA polymerase sigma-24 subunit [Planctomycetota bacterium]|nr:MAG: ECF subfamily RNA polymerase sigma-24 subunit [Planctomycetota bacterium]